jgi:hypothetical protein
LKLHILLLLLLLLVLLALRALWAQLQQWLLLPACASCFTAWVPAQQVCGQARCARPDLLHC